MTVSLIHRLPIAIYGADSVMQVFLMWSAFLPLGARFSLDNSLGVNKKRLPNHFISMATIAFICQLIIIYLSTSLVRTHPCWTKEYTALYYVFSHHEYATPLATWLLHFPHFIQTLTFLSISLEIYGVFLLIVPIFSSICRGIAIILFSLFHLTMHITLNLDWFPLIMIVCWMALIPSGWWHKFNAASTSQSIPGIKFGTLVDGIVLVILCYVLIVSCRFISMKRWQLSWKENIVENIGKSVGIYQKWNMFALDHPEWTGKHFFYLVDEKKISERSSDSFQFFEIPKTKRWAKIFGSLNLKEQSRHREYVIQYFANCWKEKFSKNIDKPLLRMEYHRERIDIP